MVVEGRSRSKGQGKCLVPVQPWKKKMTTYWNLLYIFAVIWSCLFTHRSWWEAYNCYIGPDIYIFKDRSGLNWQLTCNDSHLCLITDRLLMCFFSVLWGNVITRKKKRSGPVDKVIWAGFLPGKSNFVWGGPCCILLTFFSLLCKTGCTLLKKVKVH